MRKEMKRIVLLLALLVPGLPALCQSAEGGIPAEVFYLMPEFKPGMVYFTDQGPAQGTLNICAEDNSLRFLDNDGQELSSRADNVQRVVIDHVVFVRDDGFFYRLYPVNDEVTVALLRDVEVLRDAKKGAYGTVSRTSSIREVASFQSDGIMYKLENSAGYPYNVSETCFLYRAGSILSFNKRNLRKLFPARKDDLDAWLKSGHSLPRTLDATLEFLSRLSSREEL